MPTITSAALLPLVDNITKALLDYEAAFITNPTAAAPTVSTLANGINTLGTRVSQLADLQQEADLAPATIQDAQAALGLVNVAATSVYLAYRHWFAAIDKHVSGLDSFLAANSALVHAEFAAAFNYIAPQAAALGLRATNMISLRPGVIFVASPVTLGTLSITGASTSSYSLGATLDTTKVAPAGLFAQATTGVTNTGAGALVLAVTYIDSAGVQQNAVPVTLTQPVGGLQSLGLTGSQILNVTVTSGGTNLDSVRFTAEPARTVVY